MVLVKSRSHSKIELEIYKSIMNVGIIPCDNGLGHISRSVELANILIKSLRLLYFYLKHKKFSIQKISIKKLIPILG